MRDNITRALIGRNPCLDQAIETRKCKVKVFTYGLPYGLQRVWVA